jgi:hypothetical protein
LVPQRSLSVLLVPRKAKSGYCTCDAAISASIADVWVTRLTASVVSVTGPLQLTPSSSVLVTIKKGVLLLEPAHSRSSRKIEPALFDKKSE